MWSLIKQFKSKWLNCSNSNGQCFLLYSYIKHFDFGLNNLFFFALIGACIIEYLIEKTTWAKTIEEDVLKDIVSDVDVS